jgi:hypothetical protein
MFADPVSVTYDGTTYSLPRGTASKKVAPTGRKVGETSYTAAVAGLILNIRTFEAAGGGFWREVVLSRQQPDSDSSSFNDGPAVGQLNSVGLIFHSNDLRVGEADIPKLRAALLTLVDTTFTSRLLGGEQ